ncbi:hypothetical protein [Streptomyces albospinus]|uniref:hypothetical protein n=1 Tax=Streptomyces albospinus TaxID=285515 RepID=UPI00166FE19C|nr:hypothetical protein [Streptomyces albospinus]
MINPFSCRLLSYAMGRRHDAVIVIAAFHMPVATHGSDVKDMVFHSGRDRDRISHTAHIVHTYQNRRTAALSASSKTATRDI